MSYDRRPLPKERRSIPLKGSDTHKGKWFKCWNCGFPCFIDREYLSDQGGVGYQVVEVIDESSPVTGDMDSSILSADLFEGVVHLSRLDSDGEVIPAERTVTQQVTRGCPLCGCLRWK